MITPNSPPRLLPRWLRLVFSAGIVAGWIGWLFAGLAQSWAQAAYFGVSILLVIRTREWAEGWQGR